MNAMMNCRPPAMLRSLLLAGVPATALFLHAADARADMPVRMSLGGTFHESTLAPPRPVAATPAPDGAGGIGYFTPRVAGLRLGAAHARDADTGCAGRECGDGAGGFDLSRTVAPADMLKLGADYAGAVAGVDLSLRAGYGATVGAATPAGSDESWGLGASLGFAGFTVGAALLQPPRRVDPMSIGRFDYVIGMAYTAPDWRAALRYSDSDPAPDADPDAARNRAIGFDFAYTPSPRMTLSGGIRYGGVDDGADRRERTGSEVFVLFGTRIGF